MKFTVAIDGPAAAGKGTISKAVAEHFGFGHLDTGLLYRAVGAKVLAGAQPLAAAQALTAGDLDEDAPLRTAAVAQAASEVAALPEVREALVAFQRDFAQREGGAVLDGRDIGTVICPSAEVKLFVTASATCRARRRYEELVQKGAETDFETVLADVEKRDARDANRESAPMKAAPTAVTIDTTDLSIRDAVDAAIRVIEAAIKPR